MADDSADVWIEWYIDVPPAMQFAAALAAETVIYDQQWRTQVTLLNYFETLAVGGGQDLIPGYPEMAAGERVRVKVPGTLDAILVGRTDYRLAGVALLGIGNKRLPSGTQGFDARGMGQGVRVQAAYRFLNDGSAPPLYHVPLSVQSARGDAHGAQNDHGLRPEGKVVQLAMANGAGTNYFVWELGYRDWDAGFTYIEGPMSVMDGHAHDVCLELRPATVVEGEIPEPDGELRFLLDGVLVMHLPAIKLEVNLTDTVSDPYDCLGIWLGYAGMPGPVGRVTISAC